MDSSGFRDREEEMVDPHEPNCPHENVYDGDGESGPCAPVCEDCGYDFGYRG